MENIDRAGSDTALTAVEWLQISQLAPSDSPRIAGENKSHLRALAASGAELPPIIVHRRTMRVIDGMHRLRTAELLGQREIAVRFFDGDDLDAFVLAVKINVAHGLPLTLADRKAAAARIVRARPEWSDRAIAAIAGLSPKTVGATRARSTEEIPQLTRRVGRDGRVRRVRPAGNRSASALVPRLRAPEQELAALAGVPDDLGRNTRAPLGGDDPGRAAVPVTISAMRWLRSDPSVRFTEAGRSLLRLLSITMVDGTRWDELAGTVPRHCADSVAGLAQECSAAWSRFAHLLRQRAITDVPEPAAEAGHSKAM